MKDSDLLEKDESNFPGTNNDQVLKVLMIVEISDYLRQVEGNQFSIFTQKFHNSVSKTIRQFNGKVVKSDNNCYQIHFQSVTDAVLCAMQIQYKFKYVTPKHESFKRRLNIGLTSEVLKTKQKGPSKAAIALATRMCEVVKGDLVFSSEVAALYETENKNARIDTSLVRILSASEETFLNRMIDYIESHWEKPQFNVSALGGGLNIGKSRLYRTMKRLTGNSPSGFIREFRLHKALLMLHNRAGSITQTALKSGFRSPSYFSRCFLNTYGLLPSKYVQQHVY